MNDHASPAAPGLAWSWSLCALGVALSLPASLVALVHPPFGFALAVGVIPAAINRLAPRRAARWMSVLVGTAAGASLLLGALLTQLPPVAVAALFVFGLVAPLWARHGLLGGLIIALCLPLTGIGLSYHDIGTALVFAGLMAGSSAYAWLVSLLWPQRPPAPPPPEPAPAEAAAVYGVLLGCAGALAAALGYLLHLEHVGWIVGACLLVMRPNRSLLFLRSAGRALSVIGGALLAAALALWAPGNGVLAVFVLAAIAAVTALQASRWYVAPAFTTFLALSMIARTSDETPLDLFTERMWETLAGIGIALLFGWALPSLLVRRRRRGPRAAPRER